MPLHADQQVYRAPWAVAKNFPAWRRAKMWRYEQMVAAIVERSELFADRSDDELKQEATSLHDRAINGASLDSLLIPSFALVRESSRRVLGMTPFPVQVLAGIALHRRHIVEMATGEGKTLVSAMPAFLNALADRGVHVVTVNDYLAKRDAELIGKIHRFLGLSVGLVIHDTTPQDRVSAYRSAITYTTNKEIGFDFLRDQLRGQSNKWFEFGKTLDQFRVQKVQRPDFYYAIVDEVDSILIDEARTPLIIANAPPVDAETADEFAVANDVVKHLVEEEDFTYDRKERRVEWLRAGEQKITRLVGGRRSLTGHRIDWHESCMRALKAHVLFHRDVEYVVDNGDIVIVDESTGRKMPGRHWEDGLHQAVAAKESLELKGQSETLARTTYQVYFNRYEKLAGMTGTALPASREFAEIFNLGTVVIPTNRPCIRKAAPDRVFASEAEKWDAVVEKVRDVVAEGRPVLVGTRSIEKSEVLSSKLKEANIDHVVLNARYEEEEAAIVAQAGQPGRVTVATNMAGRGTDIILHPDVAAAGGLFVLGTERHESRRVDLQLMGRCARQGDPGSAQFYISVEDPIILRYRKAAGERLSRRYRGRGGKPIPGRGIRNFFRRVQRSIERQHRSIRYTLIKHERERMKFNRQVGTE